MKTQRRTPLVVFPWLYSLVRHGFCRQADKVVQGKLYNVFVCRAAMGCVPLQYVQESASLV